MSDDVWLVVGLGNPGSSYARMRHNVGYLVAEVLAERMGGSWRMHKSRCAHVLEGRLGGPLGPRLVLGRGRCFMNESGGPVSTLLSFYKVPLERLLVVHDELDLEFGRLRLKLGGGDNGHNGLRSIRQSVGTGEFHRLRFGIGRPMGSQSPRDFVLTGFAAGERAELTPYVERAADAAESLLVEGLERTQNKFHERLG